MHLWDRNLASAPPPPLVSTFDTTKTIRAIADVFPRPDLASVKIETVRPGRSVLVAGEIAGGWYEIHLRRGGVGYALAADFN